MTKKPPKKKNTKPAAEKEPQRGVTQAGGIPAAGEQKILAPQGAQGGHASATEGVAQTGGPQKRTGRRRGRRGGRGRRRRGKGTSTESLAQGGLSAGSAERSTQAATGALVPDALDSERSKNAAASKAPAQSAGDDSPLSQETTIDANEGDSAPIKSRGREKILINVVDVEECRIAILRESRLEELFVETMQEKLRGNIYKGRVVNIEPSIQAAFIDFGWSKNGFLHVSDVVSSYGGGDTPRTQRKIQDLLSVGQSVMVQVTRESLNQKGPSLTTYISLPGRYLVLMPGITKCGVSRKITDEETRRELRGLLDRLNPPKGMGVIIRTAGADNVEEELKRDLEYLLQVWSALGERAKTAEAPALLYQESNMVVRTLRDCFAPTMEEVVIDSKKSYEDAVEFFKSYMPRYIDRLRWYNGSEPLFARYKIEQQIEALNQNRVPLPKGAYLVINQTEAMATIDVNTGKFTRVKNPEEAALRVNRAAAEEAARQIRLRDLSGLVLIDFVDMRDKRHIQEVENILHREMSYDKARHRILRMSKFCVVEMTRQRLRHSKENLFYTTCPTCLGRGMVKTVETMALNLLRKLRSTVIHKDWEGIEVRAHVDAVIFLLNRKRAELARLEETYGKPIQVLPESGFRMDESRIGPLHSVSASAAESLPHDLTPSDTGV